MRQTNAIIDDLAKQAQQIAQLSPDQQKIQAKQLLQQAISNNDWLMPEYYDINKDQGYSLYTIYSTEDHQFGVFVTAWLPGRGAPPHTHGGWAVIGGLVGAEKNTVWQRTDDGQQPGYATIVLASETIVKPQDIFVMDSPLAIHSVENIMNEISITIHAYQKHPNFCERLLFDPNKNTVAPFITDQVKP